MQINSSYDTAINNIRKELNKSIKGTVLIELISDDLTVKILPKYSPNFITTVPDFSVKMCNGITSKSIADKILKEYKKYITLKEFCKF